MRISKECIDGCLREETASQKELYETLLPYLNAICGRYLKDKSHRKDILQDTFILIFRQIEQYQAEKGEFHSWSTRITINLCLKQNKKRRMSSFSEEGESISTLESVEPEVIDQLTNEELVKFLKTMPPKYYEVFNLFIIDGFSHEEIAEMLDVKVNLSRKRLARARKWLQQKPKSLNEILGDHRLSVS